MVNFEAGDATAALNLLSDIALRREEDIANYSVERDQQSSDEESDSPCPYFDQFLNQGGDGAIQDMCNFTALEFEQLWNLLESFIKTHYNVGRGKKSHVTGKDALFMFLAVLKHGGHWDVLGRVFKLKGPTFERMITKFVLMISGHMYELFVTNLAAEFTMHELNTYNQRFRYYPEALYAVDVTFQQSFRPSGAIQEGKLYFSGKHKLYGLKVEVSVLPTGIAKACSEHYPGSVSDFEIIQRQREFHAKALKKSGDEQNLIDVGLHNTRYPNQWAVLGDKGYQGILEILRGIHPVKRPPRGVLSISDETFNRQVSSDRIIVENFFGRLCGLWSLMSSKWRWSQTLYDDFFRAATALTNFHIKSHPLRAEDRDKFSRIRNRLTHIANQSVENRRRVLARYQERRRVRLNQEFRRNQYSQHSGERIV